MAKTISAIASSPFLYILILALGGIGSIVYGVHDVFGAGYAAIVGGLFMILLSVLIARGLRPNA